MKYKISYNHCGICGYTPGKNDGPNYAPVRWWDCDDGWKIGTLCHWCIKDAVKQKPKPADYAYSETNGICDDEETDEDFLIAL